MTQSYKTGRERNSPDYLAGCHDGFADVLRIGHCPSQFPIGPTPPNPDYHAMYDRGYHDIFDKAEPHICTESCQR